MPDPAGGLGFPAGFRFAGQLARLFDVFLLPLLLGHHLGLRRLLAVIQELFGLG